MLLTTKETMTYLKISRKTLYNWIKQKKLFPVKINRHLKFKKSDLDKLINDYKKN